MKPEQIARAMGEYIRKHGFSPAWSEDYWGRSKCGCFRHALEELGICSYDAGKLVLEKLAEIVGTDSLFDDADLRANGWTAGKTADAVAACDIAADLLAP